MGEFSAWSACTGDQLPTVEQCGGTVDRNCNGKVGCDDAMCAGMTGCCTPGTTRACYDGPAGTLGVGVCHGGTQTCTPTGAWPPSCTGEVTPGSELGHCSDGADNDCNGQTDCQDFVCLLDAACRPKACNAGATQPCYDGPPGTSGKGACHGGTQTCKSDGSGWGACTGEVLPGNEAAACQNGADDDCNGLVDCADPSCQSTAACCGGLGPTDGTIYAHSPSTLYRVTPGTWDLTKVADFDVADSMTDLAVTPDGHVYTISFTTLYAVDATTAHCSKVMDVPGTQNNGMTFLANGDLLVSDESGTLKRIDPAQKSVTTIGAYGGGWTSSGDLVAIASGTMYGISATTAAGGDASANNVLLTVDVASGKATGVGAMGDGNVWGLAYSGGKVLAFTSSGDLLQVDPQTGAGQLLRSYPNVNFWGAGTSPLMASGCK